MPLDVGEEEIGARLQFFVGMLVSHLAPPLLADLEVVVRHDLITPVGLDSVLRILLLDGFLNFALFHSIGLLCMYVTSGGSCSVGSMEFEDQLADGAWIACSTALSAHLHCPERVMYLLG
jgi:hypothetical protein